MKLAGQSALTKKVLRTHDADGGFLASRGYDGELHFSFLHIENRVGLVPLGENRLLVGIGQALPASSNRREESLGVKFTVFPDRRRLHIYAGSIVPSLSSD